MRDLANNSTSVELVEAMDSENELALSAVLTQNETSIDLKGEGRKVLLLVSVGATSSATGILNITSGSDNVTFGTTETTVLLEKNGITTVDLEPSNRYIRAEWAVSATSSATVTFAALALVYNERVRPSNVA